MAEKLTPEEIKKALECCVGESPNCNDCPANRYEAGKCFDLVKVQAVEIMNSQQAEIEEWKKINQRLYDEMEERRKEDIGIAKGYARIEAIKEFAEKLKGKFAIFQYVSAVFYSKVISIIDNLVKEMVGEQE